MRYMTEGANATFLTQLLETDIQETLCNTVRLVIFVSLIFRGLESSDDFVGLYFRGVLTLFT